MNKKLITSALLYVNGIPHIGHIAGALLPADVCARYNRLKGFDTLWIGGVDEYGTPSELGAVNEGMDIKDYVNKYYEIHKKVYQDFNLSFDYCGRTSTEKQTKLVQEIYLELLKNGFIEKKQIEQIYSLTDQRFLADRYIEGMCPKCEYEKARGDQCDNCGALLNPTDLIKPYSVISKSYDLELRKTEHAFLKLEAMQGKVEDWLKTKNGWSKTAMSIARKWLDEGLRDRCITRDLKWGVPVPDMKDKVLYVWFDAPWGYVSITQEWAEKNNKNWEDYWLSDDVEYYQFMGKDNVAFHTIFFPAEELCVDKKWKTVDVLKAQNFLNFGDGKFSKSLGNGFSLEDAISLYQRDYWRYWIMANLPETDDAVFNFQSFADTVNKDLNDVLGNFILRIFKFCAAKFGEIIPENYGNTSEDEKVFLNLDEKIKEYNLFLKQLEFRKAMKTLREIWVVGNEYIASQEPWIVIKTDEKRAMTIIHNSLKLAFVYAVLMQVIMPDTALKILNCFNIDKKDLWLNNLDWELINNFVKAGNNINIPLTFFEKIDEKKVEELKTRFKG